MKKYLYIFTFLVLFFSSFFFVSFVKAESEKITQVNFITLPQLIETNTISGVLTIETQNSEGREEQLNTSGTILTLVSSSRTGEFSSSETNWIPTSVLTMRSGSARRSFYYKDSNYGVHTLTVSAEGKSWTPAVQTITVNGTIEIDTTLPELNLPSDITEEATGHDGAIVNFTATADDINPTNPEVSCIPSSGSTFILGTTTVNCSATDNVGNTANGNFNVIVKDTTVPMITGIPSDITTEAVSDSGVNVSYVLPTATDIVDGAVVVNCLPTSDSLFPIGENVVNCSAIDNAGNTSSASFKVTVLEKVKSSTTTTKRSGSYMKILPNVPVVPITLKNVVPESVKGEVLGVEKFNFTSDLYFGVKSDEVVELQKFLISKGYLKKGAFGGFFGKYTKEAVKKFQAENPPLWVDGIVGPYTRAVLNK